MLHHIENRSLKLTRRFELQPIHDSIPRLGIVELENGTRLIVRDASEILIPRPSREEFIKKLHLTHAATETMMLQTIGRIFWPEIGLRNKMRCIYVKPI